MSTMSTQVNLGASYLVNDFYKRFIYPKASEKELVKVGKIYHKSIKHTGISIDLGLYKQLPFIHKKNKLIKDAYFGFGVFKNSEMKLLPDRIYFHYSFDFKLDLNS